MKSHIISLYDYRINKSTYIQSLADDERSFVRLLFIYNYISERREHMQEFQVVITEVLQKTVIVSADSKEEAERRAATGWKNADYLLDADDFKEVLFSVRRD